MKTTGLLCEEIINFHINNGRIEKAIYTALAGDKCLTPFQWGAIIKNTHPKSVSEILVRAGDQKFIKKFLDYLIERKQINNLIISSKIFKKQINIVTLEKMVRYHISEREENSGEEILQAADIINSTQMKKNWLKTALNQAVGRGNIELVLKIMTRFPKGTVLEKNKIEDILAVFFARANEKKETKDFSLIIRLLNYCSTTEEKEFFMNLIF